jgi:phosphoribosylanthranilate isomerase
VIPIKTKIKICGIRTINDIDIINSYIPDYAGFILAQSKRRVDLFELDVLLKTLDRRVKSVGVFVNESIDIVLKAIDTGINIVQLHGEESNNYICDLKRMINDKRIHIWKTIRVGNENTLEYLKNNTFNNVDGILLDKFSEKEYGGTGEVFDWNRFPIETLNKPIILAGGLNSKNVNEAIRIIKPFCVDVSSGVETSGRKDNEKIRDFIYSVRGIS